jgi:polysaccharide export outer membrane protein
MISRVFTLSLLICTASELSAGESNPGPHRTPPPSPEYRLGPDDVLEVVVWKEPDLGTTTVVRPDGKISLPLVSECEAVGRTVPELQRRIAQELSRYIADPVVNVIVKEVKHPKVSVIGQVRKPDQYRIVARMSVLDAVALAGGFTEFAKRDDVVVIRDVGSGARRIRLDLQRLLDGRRAEMFYLQQGDTVYVK